MSGRVELCVSCRYFSGNWGERVYEGQELVNQQGEGRCHRYPPVPVAGNLGHHGSAVVRHELPRVNQRDGCGEWRVAAS